MKCPKCKSDMKVYQTKYGFDYDFLIYRCVKCGNEIKVLQNVG